MILAKEFENLKTTPDVVDNNDGNEVKKKF